MVESQNGDSNWQTELETRVAYLENTLEQLSDSIYEQAGQLDKIQSESRMLKERLSQLEESGSGPQAKEPPPPHY